jgi:hypothetical protein
MQPVVAGSIVQGCDGGGPLPGVMHVVRPFGSVL